MKAYKSFHATVTGISHSKQDKECQDYSGHYENAALAVAVVADGHGSEDCFRSARGAKFAVDCAIRGIADFVKYLDESEEKPGLFQKPPRKKSLAKNEIEKRLRENLIAKGIIPAWYNKVAGDFTKNPITEEEARNASEKHRAKYLEGRDLHHAYGATLIAASITEDYWFGLHIGDGRFTALYKDGSFDQPVPWDERCYLNVTTSICDDDAGETARIYFCPKTEKDLPLALFLCSDGIDDNYPVNGNEQYLYKLYRTIALAFADDGFDSTCKQINDLVVQFALKGKGDDTSLSGIIDMEALKKTAEIYRKEIAAEEAETEKAEARNVADQKALAAITAYEKQTDFVQGGLGYGEFIKQPGLKKGR